MDEYLKLVTKSQNIHEIIWDVNEIAGEKIEARYFDDLGYPVKLTNASGYMSYPLLTGLYIFIDGVENDGQECRLLAEIKLEKLMGLSSYIQCRMTNFRWLDASIQKARIEAGIPIKQSLQSVKILATSNSKHKCPNYWCKENPYKPYKNDKFVIRLDTKLYPWLIEEGQERKKKRMEALRKKREGVWK